MVGVRQQCVREGGGRSRGVCETELDGGSCIRQLELGSDDGQLSGLIACSCEPGWDGIGVGDGCRLAEHSWEPT